MRRRSQGAAVAALNAFTADHSADARDGLGLVAPDQALQKLATAVDDDDLHVPRLFVLDSLVKLASRQGDLQAYGPELDKLLGGLARGAGVPQEDVAGAVATTRRALGSVSRLKRAGSTRRPWPVFAAQAAGALRLTKAETEKPLCNDAEVVLKGAREAAGVTVAFHTDATPGDLRHFCDPMGWHKRSAFQHEMKPWDGPGAVDIRRQNGWRRDLYETVELSPAKTLVTPLRFTYALQDEADPRWVHLDYVLLAETEDIAVDEGSLDVRLVTSGKHKGRTRVTAKKAILFTDPMLQDWTTVACDTFWTDTVIAAALGGAADEATPPISEGATMADAEADRDKLDKVIEKATKSAQESVATYAKLAQEAATRLGGDGPTDAGTWLQLTAKTYAQAAGDTAKAWTTCNEVLQILASQTGPPPPSDQSGSSPPS